MNLPNLTCKKGQVPVQQKSPSSYKEERKRIWFQNWEFQGDLEVNIFLLELDV